MKKKEPGTKTGKISALRIEPTGLSASRQVIGRRRSTGAQQDRGKKRRQALVNATIELLESVPVEQLTFREIANRVGMPEGSAYHFYANKYDLLTAVANQLSDLFVEVHRSAEIKENVDDWPMLARIVVDQAVGIYRSNRAAVQICLGGRTPQSVKMEDRQNARVVADAIAEKFDQYFVLPDLENRSDIFFNFVAITDLVLSLYLTEQNEISEAGIQESVRAGRGYLATYLPSVLIRKSEADTNKKLANSRSSGPS